MVMNADNWQYCLFSYLENNITSMKMKMTLSFLKKAIIVNLELSLYDMSS